MNMINLTKEPITTKRYTSWGEYVSVETSKGTYDNVLLCPSVDSKDQHILEWFNGDVVIIDTIDMISIKRDDKETYYIQ